MKNEYLRELLRDNKTVIVPGLGAFVNNDSKTQPVIFNAFLKFNDGLVIGYISKKEGISADDAFKKNEVFVSGMISLLESGRDVRIDGIGLLKKDKDGKMIFNCSPEGHNDIREEEKYPSAENTEEKEKQEEKEKEEPVIQDQSRNEKDNDKEVKSFVSPDLEKNKEEKEEKNSTFAEAAVTEQKEKEKPAGKEKKKEKPAKQIPAKQGKKKKMVLWMVLLLVAGAGGTAGYLYKDQVLALFGSNPEATSTSVTTAGTETTSSTSETEEVTTETIADTTLASEQPVISDEPVSEPVEEIITEEVPPVKTEEIAAPVSQPVSAESGSYYVITGCFNNAGNAESMIQKANAGGYQGMNIGTYGNLIHVAVFSSSDRREAHRKAGEIRSAFPNAWVMKKK